MADDEDDPLQRVVVDKNSVDRERLADAIEGIVGVDEDTGEVTPLGGYHDLENKAKFTARLLGRRAALELGFLDEADLGDSSGGFADRMGPTESTIQNYSSLDFVENDDDHGGYYVPGYAVETAIAFLETAQSGGKDDR